MVKKRGGALGVRYSVPDDRRRDASLPHARLVAQDEPASLLDRTDGHAGGIHLLRG